MYALTYITIDSSLSALIAFCLTQILLVHKKGSRIGIGLGPQKGWSGCTETQIIGAQITSMFFTGAVLRIPWGFEDGWEERLNKDKNKFLIDFVLCRDKTNTVICRIEAGDFSISTSFGAFQSIPVLSPEDRVPTHALCRMLLAFPSRIDQAEPLA